MVRLSSYDREILSLARTWESVRSSSVSSLSSCVEAVAGTSTAYVASGGALAVAQLASDLHSERLGALSRAVTPLALAGFGPGSIQSCVIFSARARHQDVAFAVEQADRLDVDRVFMVTMLRADEVPQPIASRATVIRLAAIANDGFLATNSVLLMSGMWARAHEAIEDRSLPEILPGLASSPTSPPPRARIVVLYGPPSGAAAVDLEARMSETGMAQVQLADYRNFAHGRHLGFASHLRKTSVVALVQPETIELADATIAEFPTDTHVAELRTDLPGIAGTLDLLVGTMRITANMAPNRALDVGSPEVPQFGRRLYKLPASHHMAQHSTTAVSRKLRAAGFTYSVPTHVSLVAHREYEGWLERLYDQAFGGLVLDHDGTCTSTSSRDRLPPTGVQDAIIQALRNSVPVAIATGRGRSIFALLGRWVPTDLQRLVFVGAYSGATWNALDSGHLLEEGEPDPDIVEASRRLRCFPLNDVAKIETRGHQITLTPLTPKVTARSLIPSVQDHIRGVDDLEVRIRASGHSVDITGSKANKARTLMRLSDLVGAPVLAIGDQGQHPGNDVGLLAATPFSLTVDRASGDFSRCWHLDPCNTRGPELLAKYLQRATFRNGRLRMSPR